MTQPTTFGPCRCACGCTDIATLRIRHWRSPFGLSGLIARLRSRRHHVCSGCVQHLLDEINRHYGLAS